MIIYEDLINKQVVHAKSISMRSVLMPYIDKVLGSSAGVLTFMKLNAQWFLDVMGAIVVAVIVTVIVHFIKRYLNHNWPEKKSE